VKKTTFVIAYDIGTTGVKTCLFEIGEKVTLVASAMEGYNLYVFPDGGAEQKPSEWWGAICSTTHQLLEKSAVAPKDIAGISFCSQMQGLVLVDKAGEPVRDAMSYMDQRAREELKEGMSSGLKIQGMNAVKLLKSLYLTGAVAASVKDPVWKYKWVEKNEPENFRRVHKWLDVKEYIICRMTGEFVMTRDSAFASLLYNIRPGHQGWSIPVCKMLGVNTAHLAKIINSADKAGELTQKAAGELGLCEGIPVFGGGGDASLIGVGAGAVAPGDTHIYSGTSGWVSTVVEKSMVDTSAMIAAIVGAQEGLFNYFAELETAGKCLEWVKDHLALDEIGVFLQKTDVVESKETLYTNLYDYLTKVVSTIPAGSGGVLFTPWLHGNRCPFEDPNARGMFFNISLETGKTELIRSVLEGVCMHLRWFLETQDKKVKTSAVVRFAGGGALSDVTCQILADCTGRTIETVESPQNAGAVGAAVLAAAGLKLIGGIRDAKALVPAEKTFVPNPANKVVYDKNYEVFKTLYQNNKKSFAALNG
jgi:xylulokinase